MKIGYVNVYVLESSLPNMERMITEMWCEQLRSRFSCRLIPLFRNRDCMKMQVYICIHSRYSENWNYSSYSLKLGHIMNMYSMCPSFNTHQLASFGAWMCCGLHEQNVEMLYATPSSYASQNELHGSSDQLLRTCYGTYEPGGWFPCCLFIDI